MIRFNKAKSNSKVNNAKDREKVTKDTKDVKSQGELDAKQKGMAVTKLLKKLNKKG